MMVRALFGGLASAAVLLLAPAPMSFVAPAAAAHSCKTWDARMTEDEGGSVMTATVCTDGTYASPGLILQCHGHPFLRYDLGEKAGNLEPGISAQFSFSTGDASITKSLDLEAMDNMFALELKSSDPLLALLQHGAAMTVTDVGGKFPANNFSLTGSKAAIGKVLAACNAPASAAGDDD
jgi:hypothetical protein